jgi:hypothetical protein
MIGINAGINGQPERLETGAGAGGADDEFVNPSVFGEPVMKAESSNPTANRSWQRDNVSVRRDVRSRSINLVDWLR